MHDGVFSNQIPRRAEKGTTAFFTEIVSIGGILSYLHTAMRRARILQPEDHHQNPSGSKRIQDASIDPTYLPYVHRHFLESA